MQLFLRHIAPVAEWISYFWYSISMINTNSSLGISLAMGHMDMFPQFCSHRLFPHSVINFPSDLRKMAWTPFVSYLLLWNKIICLIYWGSSKTKHTDKSISVIFCRFFLFVCFLLFWLFACLFVVVLFFCWFLVGFLLIYVSLLNRILEIVLLIKCIFMTVYT